MRLFLILFFLSSALAHASEDPILIVGSSTVYPFSAVVAERFIRDTSYSLRLESTGTGGGMKLFCKGLEKHTPSIANASRPIKDSEVKKCKENGVSDIKEVTIGYDGIVLITKKSAKVSLSLKEIFLALARDVPSEKEGELQANPYKKWSDINPNLPDAKIAVYGPPPTSGTRDAFAELAMEGGCKKFPWLKKLKKEDKNRYKSICHGFREDGHFIEAGEQDNLIVRKINVSDNAYVMGILGFSFLEANRDSLNGVSIDGVEPTYENIADENYPLSRPLFFYVKKQHYNVFKGLKEFVEYFQSPLIIGEGGVLEDLSLITKE